ncbi:cilia- and flagella-associated protein 52-like [Penaeus chinensis]|uniref:cilia- and flagella-associated protein 52-like n=1 Tax=Penaeus chinensis TaxID=139456 RepID=UPI001FB70CD0|nr:cilia- and flagella-associated protein 52-like [Penaeus chinensis]
MKEKRKIKELQLLSAIGFAGKVVGGLHQHRDRGLIYPVGVGVGVWDRTAGRHALLHSHNRPITALAISRRGNLIVSAQDSDPGCQAKVVIWDYRERVELGSYSVHREEVAAVAVSAGEEIVVSLGGPLDGYLVVWHVETKKPLCSVVAGDPGLGLTTLLCTAPVTPTLMLVGGQKLLRAWTLNSSNNRLMPTPIAVGLLERNYTCLQVDAAEEHLYASTTTGDVVKIRLNMVNGKSVSGGAVLVAVMAPKPTPIPGGPRLSRAATPGIQIMVVLPGGDIIVGEMGGTLRAYRQLEKKSEDGRPICAPPPRAHGTVKYTHPKDPTQPLLSQIWSVAVGSTITSLSLVGDLLVAGTVQSEMHEMVLPAADDSGGGGARGSARTPRMKPARRPSAETKANRHAASNGREKRGDKNNTRRVTTFGHNGERDVGMIPRVGSTPPEVHLLSTCHPDPLHDVTFPRGVGDLVVSAGVGGIRVWNVRSLDEMLRVSLPGLVCCCCCVTHTLHTIVTGWSDGRLRGLGAESGRVVWTVDDAHHGGVNTITTLSSGKVVSGGRDGRSEHKPGRENEVVMECCNLT